MLAFLLSACIACALAQTQFNEEPTAKKQFDLTSRALAIDSVDYETIVELTQNDALTRPQLLIRTFGEADVTQIAFSSANVLCIGRACGALDGDDSTSAAHKFRSSLFFVFTASLVGILSLFNIHSKYSMLSIVALLCALSLVTVSNAADFTTQVSMRYEVELQVPKDFIFDSLSARIRYGEFTSQIPLTASLMNLKMCAGEDLNDHKALSEDGSTTRIALNGLNIAESFNGCSSGSIVLGKVRSLSPTTSYDVRSTGDSSIIFEGLFSGAVDLTSGVTSSVDFRNSDCRRTDVSNQSTTSFVGSCGVSGNNQLKAESLGGVLLGFVGTGETPAGQPNVRPESVPFQYPPASSDNLVRRGAEWQFVVSDTELSDEWTQVEFDTSSWERGDAPFGYGDEDRNAQYGYELTPKVQNLYLRHKFSVSAAALAFSDKRRLLVASDDGADVFVNGQLINQGSGENHEARYWNDQFTLDDSIFNDGDNVIAIRVQNGAISSDIYFDCELSIHFNNVEIPPEEPEPTAPAPTPAGQTTTTRAATQAPQPTPPPPPAPTPPPVAIAPPCGSPPTHTCSASFVDPDPLDCAPESPAISGLTNPPLSVYTERAEYKWAPNDLDANPRTNCPHKQSNLKLWTDPATWGGNVPNANQAEIVLPENSKVLVTSCAFNKDDVYQKIRIPESSELIFADANIELHVRGIIVEGALHMGSETCRLFSKITLVFHGQKTTNNNYLDNFGTKGIYVPGSIDVHGKQFHPTWSRLSQSVQVGDDRVHLQHPVNWEVGQQVVVVTSIYEDEYTNENEVMTIKAVDGRTVQFTAPLAHHHYGGREYQVEVGLLSRRIEFRGHEADSKDTRFGGHMLITGQGRVAGVRAHMMGQTNVLARYPFHFHLTEECSDCYFKDNACHGTFYRCVTMHGISKALITRNVAFDVRGHAFYMEDGVETENTVSYNLAAHVHPIGVVQRGGGQGGRSLSQNCPAAGCSTTNDEDILQPADMVAAPFYISNAYNRYIGNAASGGFSGFAFPNLFKAIGPSRGASFSPATAKTLEFDGNTAHSAGYFWNGGGACIYTGGDLQESGDTLNYFTGRKARNTRDDFENDQGNAAMLFTNTKVFLCNIGVMHWGQRLDLENYEAIDTARVASLFGESSITNAVFNAKSGNPITNYNNRLAQPRQPHGTQFQFYDTGTKTIFDDCIMRNADRPWMSMIHSDRFKPFGMTSLNKITYENSNEQIVQHNADADTGSAWFFNWIDFDGSMSKEPRPSGNNKVICGSTSGDWWKFHNNCKTKWGNMYCCTTQDANRDDVARIEIKADGWIPGPSPTHHMSTKFGQVCMFGDDVSGRRCVPVTDQSGLTGVTGRGWYVHFDSGSPTFMTFNLRQLSSLTSVTLAFKYPAGSTFTMSFERGGRQADQVSSFAALKSADKTSLFFDGKHLFIKMVNNEKQYNNDNCYQHDPVHDFAKGDNGVYIRHYSYCNRWNFQARCSVARTINGVGMCNSGNEEIPTVRLL